MEGIGPGHTYRRCIGQGAYILKMLGQGHIYMPLANTFQSFKAAGKLMSGSETVCE